MRALHLLLAVLVLGSIGWGEGSAVQASPVVSSGPPQRIVSLQPALTEAVCALGACARLVGVDRYSSWPPEFIAQLPVVGGGLDPSIEAIVALRPDVVLLSRSTQAAQRLHALGIRTVALDADTLAEVHALLQRVGDVLQVPAAQGADALWRRIQSDIDAAATSVPTSVRGVRVYFEVGRGPFAAGPQSFIGAILTRLGAENVVPACLGRFHSSAPSLCCAQRPT